ncbi:hypothetical protein DCAR_0727431 [Daucus carota subsp. sativus]|uniref:Uncharacterized protein n=1 Tax=Daucus carota subsp. sativus TaxID=79200 RepID=A0A161ZIP8_DAUCS|nr:hypothetical protein DCAR_0727431 [Daucus carota subsp. sativus]
MERKGRAARGRPTGNFSKSRPITASAKRGSKRRNQSSKQWKEIKYIKLDELKGIQAEVEKYKDLIDEEIPKALKVNGSNIIRYAYNILERVKRCVDSKTLEEVSKGDAEALEVALQKLIDCSWEGPVVRFADRKMQERSEKREESHRKIILQCERWVDENVLKMVEDGCEEGLRMATNQTHYKSLRNMEYGKSFYEALMGKKEEPIKADDKEEDWTVVRRRRRNST